jgi:hypothetical protein
MSPIPSPIDPNYRNGNNLSSGDNFMNMKEQVKQALRGVVASDAV